MFITAFICLKCILKKKGTATTFQKCQDRNEYSKLKLIFFHSFQMICLTSHSQMTWTMTLEF